MDSVHSCARELEKCKWDLVCGAGLGLAARYYCGHGGPDGVAGLGLDDGPECGGP